MTEAFITHELITWALRRSGITEAQAAKRVQVPQPRFSDWQRRGGARPTFHQAEMLARVLHIPFGFLFLSNPPKLQVPLPDLRTIRGTSPDEFSPEFYDVINDALRKQEWYRSYLEAEGAKPLPFVGRFSPGSPVRVVAAEINDTLAISREIRRNANSWEEFLRDFILKAEQIGVLVLKNSVVGNNTSRPLNVEEFRGFVISDDIAPLIFLNGADAKSAQIFTLAHELAHLWIGQSGISNPDYRKRASEQKHPIERICDSVAAEALVLEQDFLSGWDSGLSLETNIVQLARHFKVSRIVILRRAYELDRISDEEYQGYYDTLPWGGRTSGQGGGGDFYLNLQVRNSRTFAQTVVEAVLRGRTSDRTAARLLNVQVPVFHQFTAELTGTASG
ncbi:MAG: XRE family transcriptional regulator [Chloroflexota bacterium]|nr:XRE family transcriptional regulator [Chloroflexota bacterium]